MPIFRPRIAEGRDPVAWLRERLSVNYPGNAEIMQVSVACTDPQGGPDPGERRCGCLQETAVVDAEANLNEHDTPSWIAPASRKNGISAIGGKS